jgi:hypothetical protein
MYERIYAIESSVPNEIEMFFNCSTLYIYLQSLHIN